MISMSYSSAIFQDNTIVSLVAFDMFSLSLIFISLVNICLGIFLLRLSCMGLSALPRLGYLFPFSC